MVVGSVTDKLPGDAKRLYEKKNPELTVEGGDEALPVFGRKPVTANRHCKYETEEIARTIDTDNHPDIIKLRRDDTDDKE